MKLSKKPHLDSKNIEFYESEVLKMTYQMDSSGINSLAGFAYQIKVFSLYAFELTENTAIEFETIEDVNLKAIKPEQIDRLSQNFTCKSIGETSNSAIQVKHTDVDSSTAQKMILNWLLLENSEHTIDNYVLFTDKIYQNSGAIFAQDAHALFDEIVASKKRADAAISKVKSAYKGHFDDFAAAYQSIQDKYQFRDIEDIDLLIQQAASIHFRKSANEVVFYQRLKGFLMCITAEILDSISEKKPYIMSFKRFISIVEEISNCYTDKLTAPSYTDFKKVNPIDLNESEISTSREFLQLKSCKLPENAIKRHLSYGLYYHATSIKYLENNRTKKVEDILETTFENFEDAKLELQSQYKDTPYNRLSTTKAKSNSNAENEQIKFGSAIYLTKDDIDEKQISWEDEENEEH